MCTLFTHAHIRFVYFKNPIGGNEAQRFTQAQNDCYMAQPKMEQAWCLAVPGKPFDLSRLPYLLNGICPDTTQSSE